PELLRRRGRLRKGLWIFLVERRNLARAAGLHLLGELEREDLARPGPPLPALYGVPNRAEAEPPAPAAGPRPPDVPRGLARPRPPRRLGELRQRRPRGNGGGRPGRRHPRGGVGPRGRGERRRPGGPGRAGALERGSPRPPRRSRAVSGDGPARSGDRGAPFR